MNRLIAFLLLFPLSTSCQTKKIQKSEPVFESTPMSCRIKGRVIRIMKPAEQDKGSVCAQYPCRAQVKILDVSACGSSVSLPLNAGDIVTIRFVYTLHATARLFPGMKAHYPGLKKGAVFFANAEQRLAIGSAGEFVVSAYALN